MFHACHPHTCESRRVDFILVGSPCMSTEMVPVMCLLRTENTLPHNCLVMLRSNSVLLLCRIPHFSKARGPPSPMALGPNRSPRSGAQARRRQEQQRKTCSLTMQLVQVLQQSHHANLAQGGPLEHLTSSRKNAFRTAASRVRLHCGKGHIIHLQQPAPSVTPSQCEIKVGDQVVLYGNSGCQPRIVEYHLGSA